MAREKLEYPGPEGFWRTSPELIGMQPELAELWANLGRLPDLTGSGILALTARSVVAVGNLRTSYTIFETDRSPSRASEFPGEQYIIRAREAQDVNEQQISVHLSIWPSGYRIEGDLVRVGFDNSHWARLGVHSVKELERPIYYEAIRQVALKEKARYDRLKQLEEENGPEWQEILRERENVARIIAKVTRAAGE